METRRILQTPSLPVPCAEDGEEWQDGQAVTGVLYKGNDDQEHVAHANLTVVCDGMHSTLRKKLGTPDLKTPSHFVGLKLKGCALPYSNFGHVVLANPSPLLFYPISSVEVSAHQLVDSASSFVERC